MRQKILFNTYIPFTFICLAIISQSCGSYKQNIMFVTEEERSYEPSNLVNKEKNYTIQVNDYLDLQVFTQNGERIIDPDREFSRNPENINNTRPRPKFIVRNDGKVKFPLVGVVDIAGKTLAEAEKDLKMHFSTFYTDPFVQLVYLNKRVIVLGNNGGQVVPLENENTRVVEILALSQSINNNAKAHNIRLLRGNEAYVLDFSTIDSYAESNIIVEPDDVLYIEPVRRPFNEFIKDNGPIIGIVTSLVSLVAVLVSIR